MVGKHPSPQLAETKHNDGQSKKFIDAARSLECDESEERFDAALKKIAAHKPKNEIKTTEAQVGPGVTPRQGRE
jgi:hypothetical protein